MSPSRVLLGSKILAVLILLAGCTQPDKQARSNSTTFFVADAGGSASSLPMVPGAAWKIPNSVNVSFVACLKDSVSQQELRNQNFAIEEIESGKRIESLSTNRDGCLQWSEPLTFNYLSKKSAYVTIQRAIVGSGVYPGRLVVRYAVNPWMVGEFKRESGKDVVYLDPAAKNLIPMSKLVASEKALSALSGDLFGRSQLIVPEVSIKTVKEGNAEDGIFINSVIEMNPIVRVENSDGVPTEIKIEGAQFNVISHLVANNVGPDGLAERKVILTARQDQSNVGVVRFGKLVVNAKAFVGKTVANGNLELALWLQPKGVNPSLIESVFSGVYLLGDIHELGGNSGGLLKAGCEEGCDISNYLKEANNYKDLEDAKEVQKNRPFLFGNLKLRFFQVMSDETATQRTVAYAASVCISDRNNGSRLIQAPFTIQMYDENGSLIDGVIKRKTDNEGCLRWPGKVSHHYYKPEKFIKRTAVITRGAAKQTMNFYLNPWDDKFTFGFDEEEFGAEFFKNQNNTPKVPSRFYLADYSYHTVRFKYDIDPFMQLEVKKTILMEIQPRVLRYSGIINARKMTESLRDGLYLMKVAIQKNYLDPADPGRIIRNKPGSVQVELVDGLKVPSKEFISAKSTLVRVTDGMIIQPVELSMHDLRLMRVRSNFLIQLQTIDERKIQVENALRDQFQTDLNALNEERKARLQEYNLALKNGVEQDSLQVLKNSLDAVKARAEARRDQIEKAFHEYGRQLDTYNRTLQPFDMREDRSSPIMNDDSYERIRKALAVNDFTKAKLRSSDEMNLDEFLEPDSGLERRTFVGPVIFLSNTYKDSVRATDNLDEAKCGQDVGDTHSNLNNGIEEGDDDFVANAMKNLFKDISTVPEDRENPFYTFSEYFGSLRHLCNASVDDLIAKQAKAKSQYRDIMGVMSSPYNFALTYGLNYVSLKDVPLTKYDSSCKSDKVADCIKPTSDLTLKREFVERMADVKSLESMVADQVGDSEKQMACKVIFKLAAAKFEDPSWVHFNIVHPKYQWRQKAGRWLEDCLDYSDSISVDRKLRVIDTDNDYIFLGGLQLNFNVGVSFSVSESNSWSGSFGFEAFDVVGPMASIGGMGPMLKPASLKISRSNSLSQSDGTSISQQTYLVSQIAKFNLNITRYEKCYIYRISQAALSDIAEDRVNARGTFAPIDKSILNSLSKGLMICDGQIHETPRNVDEIYFYFTQHFTEGDMLDQADLYNHPWLLALRGLRDFASFVNIIQAQEEVSMMNYFKGTFESKKTPLGWPLAKLTDSYRQITPSYPGYYTLLEGETFTTFPLENRFTKIDKDCNGELGKPAEECYLKEEKVKETEYFH